MTNYLDDIKNEKFEVRLAKTEAEVVAAQKLRYKIFFEEDGAKPSEEVEKEKRDFDEFDLYCDHLIAIDKNAGNDPEDYVIGTYRLMRKVGAKSVGKWYSQAEFDVEKFNDYDGEVLELGRACVHKDFRSKVVMQMLWNGLAAYMFDFDIKLMFGCGSFLGTDVNSAKEALSYLYYNHTADGKLEINARTENAVPYPLVPKEEIDERKAFISLPTMIKGYLRVGCKVSKSIFVDYSFNTFDVCIIFETKNLKQSYLEHYEKKIKG
ncbi:MAG: GNAT family N-acetyltransferase [Alphaproteobacteria bacterium]|nr:GNAT family N-acetyltransferase [Alphaproteobacteria bacterium]